jgi:L-asparaginase II
VSSIPLVRVVRSGVTEAVHMGSVVVVDADGSVTASAGDPSAVTFARSSMKPLQAAVSLATAGDDLPDPEVAVMCASHNAEPVHVAAVDALLARAELGREALRTPAGLPLDDESARLAAGPEPVLHNCSGKHAGMLLACRRAGFDLSSYRDAAHPLQIRVEAAVRQLAGEPTAVGIDGCGVPVHALPLVQMARLYAGLAGERLDGAVRAVGGMRAAPYLVAGRNRVCTAVMERVPDVVVKIGAEGLICAGLVGRGLGVAIKVDDGSSRALDPALVRALRLVDAIDAAGEDSLRQHARPPVLGGGRPVGEMVADFDLVPGR